MTARPLDPASRRRPASAAIALVLLLAMVMVAGCASQSIEDGTETFPKDKFVVLEYRNISEFSKKISGGCIFFPSACAGPGYSFSEDSGILSVPNTLNESVNESMILFFDPQQGRKYQCISHDGWGFVHSLPARLERNTTIDSIAADGTVALRFNTVPIVLKPKECRENSTYVLYSGKSWENCLEEIIITESICNAGVFNKSTIDTRPNPRYWNITRP